MRRPRRGSRRRSGPTPRRPGRRRGAGELVDGDVDGAGDAGLVVLVGAADVEDDDLAVVADLGEVGERRGGEGAQLAVGPVLRAAGGVGGGSVDADADQLALGLGDILGALAQEGDGGAPGDEPAEVRGEAAVEPEVERARGVPGREGGARAQVDDPLTGLDAVPQLVGVGDRRRREVGFGRAFGVGRSHVGVVGRPGAETGQQLLDVGLLVLGQDRVGLLLAADGRRRRVRLGGRAERAEAVRREHLGLVREQVGQPVSRGVLVAHERVGVLVPEEVGTTGGAVQQRPAGKHADVLVAVCCGFAEQVGEVGERVAGGCQRGDAHPSTHLDDLSIRYGGSEEGHVVLAIDEVLSTGALREREATGDVVVVDVGLEDVGEPDPVLLEQGEDPVDVALGVDHERDLTVVNEVGPVTQRRGLDGNDGQVCARVAGLVGHLGRLLRVGRLRQGGCIVQVGDHRPTPTARPDETQAWVPPATE